MTDRSDPSSRAPGKAVRRTERPHDVQALFDEALYMPLDWPGKTVRLRRDSVLDHRQRITSSNVSPAELLHENSKLHRAGLPELASSRCDAGAVRLEYVRRRAAWFASMDAAAFDLHPPLGLLLNAAVDGCALELFYSIEILIVCGNDLLGYEPLSRSARLIDRLSASKRRLLDHGLSLTVPEAAGYRDVILLLCSFARNEILLGARGYRRAVMEAGMAAQTLLSAAANFGLQVRPLHEFGDRDVDAAVQADGVEQGVVLALGLEGGHGDSEG